MKTIGLIGGMSWESSAHYYRLINEGVRAARGATASARCILWSFDFAEIAALQHAGDWNALSLRMVEAARALERAGAQALVLCTNTMHRLAPDIAAATPLPLLHIADPAAQAALSLGARRVGLIGTAFTMEQPFLRDRLATHGLEVITPDAQDRAEIHRIIYDELIAGIVSPVSRAAYRAILHRLAEQGAEAIILGCTEIMLLVDESDSTVPLLDTTALHAAAAVSLALAD
ncbi:aspartate/glutamate racemase family protein [Novosphingobium sp. KACC 22771]|uniref:aspartate/glutamate racemase family protein n=1 Tax=Novosphingobium sp. KACC 22771 TaxID=3025670 RepID=UPI0023671E87|nr:aspartate/glutamate racemase family protein [Novosphingobium sp. KACC 22771]WDF71124.1 aspartate/glutamate racemase family protein [Novosphingobium sp. KACC 22771]